LGRQDRGNPFWQLNFGLRPADELYNLRTDADCVHNLASEANHGEHVEKLCQQMEAKLKAHEDPRMLGRGHIFDQYKPTQGDGFYQQFKRGEKVKAGWVNETDFEPEPIPKQ